MNHIKIEEQNYPRVLVINGEPFNSLTATGITLSNLFFGWPRDKIAQIYTARIKPDDSICDRSLRLTNGDLFPINKLRRLIIQQQPQKTRIPSVSSSETNRKDMMILSKGDTIMRRMIVPIIDLLPYQLPNEAINLIKELDPQVIYTLLGNIRLTHLVQTVSDQFELPVVPHFMDDWISTYSVPGKSTSTFLHRTLMQKKVRHLFLSVPLGLSIGEAMAKEYENRFRRRFEVFMNPVSVPETTPRKIDKSPIDRTVRFIYVGGLHLSREVNIKEIGLALALLREEGIKGELHVYAPSHDISRYETAIFIKGIVRICGSILPEQVQQVLLDSDVAVHVESFIDSHTHYTRLSVSTKIPQYFAAGLPVLAYGPAHLASCRYVSDYKCGYVVGSREPRILKDALRDLIIDSELRNNLGRQGWTIARSSHEINSVRNRFRQTLLDVPSMESHRLQTKSKL